MQEEFANEMGSVLEVDLYYANPFMPLSDKVVIEKIMKYLSQCDKRFGGTQIVDSSVLRYKEAVTLFLGLAHTSIWHLPRRVSQIYLLRVIG